MNCVELQQSLAEVEDGSSVEQRAHLRACPACSALVRELNLIVAAASQLQAADEPSPRVWNSIEIALRQEGLIRPQRGGRLCLRSAPAGARRDGWCLRRRCCCWLWEFTCGTSRCPISWLNRLLCLCQVANPSDLNDDDLMQEVADNAPAMKTQYEENLRQVNESIRDAQGVVDESSE